MNNVMQSRLKAFVKKNGIKQRYIAQSTGLKEYHVSDLFTNRTEMGADEFVAICIALGKSPDFFAFEQEES